MNNRRPPHDQKAPDWDPPAPAPATIEEWTGLYLDLIQRNWTAWLESTPAMFKSALAAADKADATARATMAKGGEEER